MSDPMIMPVKPGTLNMKDRAALRKVGVIVVECDEPEKLKLIQPRQELDGFGMLIAALRGIRAADKDDSYHRASRAMVAEMTAMLEANFATKEPT